MIATWMLIVYYLAAEYAYKEHEYNTRSECMAAKEGFEELHNKYTMLPSEYRLYICVEK